MKREIAYTSTVWVSGAATLCLIATMLPGLTFETWEGGAVAVLLITANAVLWPILSRLTFPFLAFMFGAGALIFNGLALWVAAGTVPGVAADGPSLTIFSTGMAAVITLVSGILTIDDDAAYYRSVFAAVRHRRKVRDAGRRRGVIVLEVDGLSERALRRALERGYMPTLAGWLGRGTHKLKHWETDLSSQSGASQAGILHGKNEDIPAFRWVEKESNNRIMTFNAMSAATTLEGRISSGRGLLAVNGGSRTNIFSGDAKDSVLTYSRIRNLREFYAESWDSFYSVPYNLAQVVVLSIWEMILEIRSRARQWRKGAPMFSRGWTYLIARAIANAFLREVTTYIVAGDIIAGQVDIVYATYLGYDEVAHHSGVDDLDTYNALRQLDRRFARIDMARALAPRPYLIAILSDHGQTKGVTFKQLYGFTLEGLVRRLLPERTRLYYDLDAGLDPFSQLLTEPLQRTGGSILRQVRRFNVRRTREDRPVSAKDANIIVLASGNLGLVYFTQWAERLTYEQIMKAYPDMIPGLSQHPGIGFIVVRTEGRGTVAIGSKGVHYLAEGGIEGEDPLRSYGKHAVQHLLRTDGFRHAPDILVMGKYDPEKDEAVSFEELIGVHGGLGGDQSRPFLLYPSEWDLEGEDIVGAEKLHAALKRCIEGSEAGLTRQGTEAEGCRLTRP